MTKGDFLSRKLTDLRKQAGLSQEAAADAAEIGGPGGAGQVRLSRIETGAHPPTEDEVRRLCTLYRAPRAVRENCLLWAARDTDTAAISARKILGRASEHQTQLGWLEEASSRICVWQPLLIPGLLQTEGYARAVFSDRLSGAAAERAVAARLARASILASDREFTFVVSEGALRWSAGPAVMREQLTHLAEATGRYRVGIISQARTVTTFPVHGFALFDDGQVVIGLRHATELVGDPVGVAEYVAWFIRLEELAVFGKEAQQVIQDVAASYRAVGKS
jgi:transcriptional regulator with XRE-family HTH domain